MTRRGALAAVVMAIALAACGGGGGGGSSSPSSSTKPPVVGPPVPVTTASGCTSDAQMDSYGSTSIVHTDAPGYEGPLRPLDNPRYTVDPPSGGDHLSAPVGPGLYLDSNVPPDGNLVHSLEHGYAIIWVRSDLSAADLQIVRQVLDAHRRDVLVVARPSLTVPVAATAWGHRLLCPTVSKEALDSFVRTFANKGPERVPH